MICFEKFKEEFPSNETFPSLLTSKDISDKKYEAVLKIWDRIEMKFKKDYHDLLKKCDVLLLADVFENVRNSSLKIVGYS